MDGWKMIWRRCLSFLAIWAFFFEGLLLLVSGMVKKSIYDCPCHGHPINRLPSCPFLPLSWTSANPFHSPYVVCFGWQEVRVFYVFVDKIKSKWWLTDVLSFLRGDTIQFDLRNICSIGLTTLIQLASRFLPKIWKSVPKRATFLDPKPAPRNEVFWTSQVGLGLDTFFQRVFVRVLVYDL